MQVRVGRSLLLVVTMGTAAILASCSSPEPTDPTAFCDALRLASAVNSPVATIDIDDSSTLDGAIAELRQLAELAPDAISADVTLLTDVYAEVLTSLASTAPGARGDVLRDLQPRLDEAGDPTAALERYAQTTCSIRFDGPAQPTPTPTPLNIDD